MRHIFRTVCIALVAILLCSEAIFVTQASAISDIQRYSRQGAWAINDTCEEPTVGSVTLAGNDNTEKILNFFMRKGLNLAQASGIVGNMMQESNLQPNVVQGGRLIAEDEEYSMENGVGFGLVQWTFTRRQKPLQNHVDTLGVKNTDLGGQLSYVWVELNGDFLSTLNNLRRTNDPVDAAIVVHGATNKTASHPRFQALNLKIGEGYEASNDSAEDVIGVRGGAAQEIYDTYKDAAPLAGSSADTTMNNPSGEATVDEHGRAQAVSNLEKSTPSAANGCASPRFAGGNFEETLKAYAWSEYKGLDIAPTDEYAAAVQTALGQGLYVGGIQHRGIDCGGFVTLLLRDSGYESGYNYDGKGGATGTQEEWMQENWTSLGSSSSISEAKLQPGDVAINSGHTFVYVGEVEGFGANIASASLDERAPMADTQQSPLQPGYNWYSK